MINQKELKKWLKAMRDPKARKAVSKLEIVQKGRKSNCCLGVYCKVAKCGRTLSNGLSSVVLFDGQSSALPSKIALKLGINYIGELTSFGMEVAQNIFKVSDDCASLAMINDLAYPKDKTFKRVAALIEHLAKVEQMTGKDCFLPQV